MDKEKLYNYDNEFSIRFKLDNGKQLEYVPNGVFMLELPNLVFSDMANDVMETESKSENFAKLTLRSRNDKLVEKEIFTYLINNEFDMEVSLSNPNVTDYELNRCSVAKIEYTPLIRRQKSSFFNYIVQLNVSEFKYHIGDTAFSYGNLNNVDYMSLAKDNKGEEKK